MHFSKPAASIMALFATSASAGLIEKRDSGISPAALVDSLNNLTQEFGGLQTLANGLNSTGGIPLLGSPVSGAAGFQDIIGELQGIITTSVASITALSSTTPFTDIVAEQQVCDAFTQFVTVQQGLLSVLTGKSGLLQGIALAPIAAVLLSLGGVVDTLTSGIINAVPLCAAQVAGDKQGLDLSYGKAICAYIPTSTLGLKPLC